MATVGFIGLGVMGKPMAKQVLAAGHEVIVHNRSQQAVDELVADGATAADGAAALAMRCDIVITVLPSDTEVLEVVLGKGGVLEGIAEGASVVDMSTTKPQTAKEVGEACEAAGVGFLDAPVSGGEVGAIAGTLSIMVGGPDQTFEAVRPVLEAMGGSIVHVGPNGAGQLVKAANQIIVGVTIAAVAEAFGLAQKSGVDQAAMREALLGGFASSRILDLHGQRIIDGNFTPGFRAELHLKDLEIAMSAAHACHFPAAITSHVRDLYREMVGAGGGTKDHSALFLHLTDALADGQTDPVDLVTAIGGIIPALVTPTSDGGAPDLARLPEVLDHVLDAGVHGVFAMGGQGEFWAFTPEEQTEVARAVVAHVDGRVPVLIGISAETSRQCQALAARAADSGADLVTLMPPMVGPLTQSELEAHVTAIADASALPVVLYNHPARARTAFSPSLTRNLSAHPGIVGIKDSSGSLPTLLQLQQLATPDFSVLVGNDAMISSALLAGCAGAVAATGNVAPALLVAIHDACAAGDAKKATLLQQRLLPLREAFALGSFPVVVKEAMAMIGLPVGPAAAPIAPLTDNARQQLRAAVDSAVAGADA